MKLTKEDINVTAACICLLISLWALAYFWEPVEKVVLQMVEWTVSERCMVIHGVPCGE